MVEVKCKNCEAIFKIDGNFIPEDMICFCSCEEFEITQEKKELIA